MDEAMETAIAAVMTHGMSFRKASKDFGVKVTRLFHAVQRRRGQISKPRRPHLTREDEERLIDHGFQVARFGRRFARMSMKEMAAKMAEKNGQPFKNSLPCDVWWLKFLNKHAGLTAALNETWKTVDQPQPDPY